METRILKSIFILTFLVALSSCSKNKGVVHTGFYSKIANEQGCYFEVLDSNGKKIQTVIGKNVTYGGGQLLDRAYFRQYNLYNDYLNLILRFSFGREVKEPNEVMYESAGHGLSPYKLLLQETQTLTGVVVEMFSGYDDNGTGKVTLFNNMQISDEIYHTVGEFEVSLLNKEGVSVTLKGIFWRKEK